MSFFFFFNYYCVEKFRPQNKKDTQLLLSILDEM